MNDSALIEHFCQKVYFPVEPISVGTLASMYGVLYMLLKEFELLQNPLAKRYDLSYHVAHCGKKFDSLLETYEIVVVPSFENVFALTMWVS